MPPLQISWRNCGTSSPSLRRRKCTHLPKMISTLSLWNNIHHQRNDDKSCNKTFTTQDQLLWKPRYWYLQHPEQDYPRKEDIPHKLARSGPLNPQQEFNWIGNLLFVSLSDQKWKMWEALRGTTPSLFAPGIAQIGRSKHLCLVFIIPL